MKEHCEKPGSGRKADEMHYINRNSAAAKILSLEEILFLIVLARVMYGTKLYVTNPLK